MATTTNYGWVTPDDVSLVKDGAAAIRTLGSSADTTTKALNPETTLGDLAYRSSTANVKTRLGIGGNGTILTSNGTEPSWAAPAASGGLTLISETVASGLSSLSFSSLGSFKQLILNWSGIRHSTTGSAFAIRFNNTSTSSYLVGGIAANDNVVNNTTNTLTSISRTDGESSFPFGDDANDAQVSKDCYGQLNLDNYTSSTKDKSYTCIWAYYDNSSAKHRAATTVGMFDGTTAITSIDIFRTAGSATFSNAGDTTIRLYGLQ